LLKSIVPSIVLAVATLGIAACAGAAEGSGRYRLPAEVRFARDVAYPARVASITADLCVITAATMGNPDYGVRYAGVSKGLNHVLKTTQGMLDGFARNDEAAPVDAQDADFRAWYRTHGSGARTLLADLDIAIAADVATTRLENAWLEATHSDLLRSARMLYRLALARQKPDAQREAGGQERELASVTARLGRIEQSFVPSVDGARWQAALVRYAKIDPKFRPQGLDALLPAPGAVRALYQSTGLADANGRLAWIGRDPEAFRKSNDPFIALAVRMQDMAAALHERRREADANLERVIPQYMAALSAWKKAQGKPVYANAD
jgi:hypothetical protein